MINQLKMIVKFSMISSLIDNDVDVVHGKLSHFMYDVSMVPN